MASFKKGYFMIFISIFLILFFIFNLGFGANISNICNSNLNESIILNNSIECRNSSSFIFNVVKDGIIIDCNNYDLIGNNSLGINLAGRHSIQIKNCNFKNFSKAINIGKRIEYYSGTLGYRYKKEVYSENIFIFNNSFENNIYDIYDYKTINLEIYNNSFLNSNFSTFLDYSNSKFYNNYVKNGNVYYTNTKNKLFIYNNLTNILENSTGPKEDKFYLYDNLKIDSPIELIENKSFNISNVFLESGAVLDCSNSTIFADSIQILGYNNIQIKNCNFNNLKNGIYIDKRVEYYSGTLGYANKRYYYPYNIRINNNNFNYSVNGIIVKTRSKLINISGNIFRNNLNNIHLDRGLNSIYIYNNSFYNSTNKTIDFTETGGLNFCYNNVSNIYINSSLGPKCSCIYPFSNLFINSNVNFCKGNYNNISNIQIGNNLELNCSDSFFYGQKNLNLFYFYGSRSSKLFNCNIYNYNLPIRFNTRSEVYNRWGDRRYFIYQNNFLENLNIINNNYGLYFGSKFGADSIIGANNLTFLDNSQDLYSVLKNKILINNSCILNISENEKNKFIFENLKPNKKIVLRKKDISDLNIYFKNNSLILKLILDNNYDFCNSFELNLKIYSYDNYNNFSLLFEKNISEVFLGQRLFDLKYNLENFSLPNSGSLLFVLDQNNKTLFFKKLKFQKLDFNFKVYYNNINLTKLKNNISFNKRFGNYFYFFNISYEYILDYNLTLNETSINNSLKYNKIVIFLKKSNISKVLNLNNSNIFEVLYTNENEINKSLDLIRNYLIFKSVSKEISLFGSNFESFFNFSNDLLNQTKKKIWGDLFSNFLDFNLKINKKESKIIDLTFDFNNEILNESEREFYLNNSKFQKILTRIIYKKNSLNNKAPIIMAGGLWSDYRTFEKLSDLYYDFGRDVFLIEITGGDDLERNLNYDFNFLKKYYLPFIIKNIQNITNSKKYIYIGHSNGARTFIESLNEGYLNYTDVESAFILGVPGRFEDLSIFAKLIKKDGSSVIRRFEEKNIINFPISQITFEFMKESVLKYSTLKLIPFNFDGSKISLNLFKNYFYWINSSEDLNPGINVELEKVYFVGGNLFGKTDGIVSVNDVKNIYGNINSNNKKIIFFKTKHSGMSENKKIMDYIFENLN